MKIEKIALENLAPNSYNPNSMTPEKMEQLKKTLKNTGYLQFIIARPIEEGKYEIIDGEHRWQVMKDDPEFNTEPQYVVVVDSDEDLAKAQTINFNNLRGEMDSVKVATIVTELLQKYSRDEVDAILGLSAEEVLNFEQLVDFDIDAFDNLNPDTSELDNIDTNIDPTIGEDKILSFTLTPEEHDLFQRAKHFLPSDKDRSNDKECVFSMIKIFLRSKEKEQDKAAPVSDNTNVFS